MTPVGMFWRHAHPFTAAVVVPQYKEFGESNRAHYERALGWLDGELAGPRVPGDARTTPLRTSACFRRSTSPTWIGLEDSRRVRQCESVARTGERTAEREGIGAGPRADAPRPAVAAQQRAIPMLIHRSRRLCRRAAGQAPGGPNIKHRKLHCHEAWRFAVVSPALAGSAEAGSASDGVVQRNRRDVAASAREVVRLGVRP